jgi:hypothetical protein
MLSSSSGVRCDKMVTSGNSVEMFKYVGIFRHNAAEAFYKLKRVEFNCCPGHDKSKIITSFTMYLDHKWKVVTLLIVVACGRA